MRLLTRLLVSATAITALAACGSKTATSGSYGGPGSARVGAPAPAWSLPLSTGGTLKSSSLAGKPVYLNFFATWCPPCNDEAPSVNALAQKYTSAGLVVIGVDVAESAAKAQLFRTEHHLTYPAVVDSGTLQDAYSAEGLPIHAFIGRDGKLQNVVIGQMDPPAIERAIRAIVATSRSSTGTSP